MVTLYHPVLDAYTTTPTERSAAVLRRSGWTDPPETEPNPELEVPTEEATHAQESS